MSITSRFFLFAALLATSPALALPVCAPTAAIATSSYPGAVDIPTTNNLLLPTGKSIEADGQKLIIQGRVVDKNCMPVQEATVELWQANPYGKYSLAEPDQIVTPNPLFAGAGRATTNDDGYFTFTTGFPGEVTYYVWESYKVRTKEGTVTKKRRVQLRRTPHLNLRIAAEGFQPFNTVLFFDGDRRNETDVVYKKLSAEQKNSVTLLMSSQEDGVVYGSKEIVLRGSAPYQRY